MATASRRALWLLALAVLSLFPITWFISSVPLALKVGVAGLLAVAAIRPGLALLIWAGMAPLSTSLAGLTGLPSLGAALLEVMTTSVIFGAVVRSPIGPPTHMALPAIFMSSVAIASGLSELPARFMTATQEHLGGGTIGRLLVQHAVDRLAPLDPWYFALLVVEGCALAWAAERLTRQDADLAPKVVWYALLGHAGVGVLNVVRLIGASMRADEFPASLPRIFLSVRVNTQYDVNAAASILVMVILAAVGLASRRARVVLAPAIGIAIVSLWVAGSRVAMAALLLSLTAVLLVRARRSAKALWAAGGVFVVSVGVIGWIVIANPAQRNLSLPATIASRAVLFKAAFGMIADAPVLGVGAGTFLEESPNYGSEALAPLVYDHRTRDNAHNYFLQTLAEQGIVGLIALVAMLIAALLPALRAGPRHDVLLTWLTAGVGASILTWMTGHPLLLTEAALMFWLFTGMLAGLTAPPGGRRLVLRRVTIAASIAILVSIPFRAVAVERAANLEHRGIGVSLWQNAVDGERYREANTEFSLFLPAEAAMALPIRSATGSPVTVELRIDSRPIDRVVAPPGLWRAVRVQLPESASRYIKVDFLVTDPTSCARCLWVGKALPVTRR